MRTDSYILLCDIGINCDSEHDCSVESCDDEFYTYASRILDESHAIDDNTKIRDIGTINDDGYDTYDFCVPCFQREGLILRLEDSQNPCLFCGSNIECNKYVSKNSDNFNRKEILIFCKRCHRNGNWKKIFIRVKARGLNSDDRFNGQRPTYEKVLEIKRLEQFKNFVSSSGEHENPFL